MTRSALGTSARATGDGALRGRRCVPGGEDVEGKGEGGREVEEVATAMQRGRVGGGVKRQQTKATTTVDHGWTERDSRLRRVRCRMRTEVEMAQM